MRLFIILIIIGLIYSSNFAQILPDSVIQDSLLSIKADEFKAFNNLYLDSLRNNSFVIKNAKMKQLPVRDFNDLIQLHPSVIIQDGKVHIRGGRADENGYLIDGAWATNPMDNSNGIYIIPEMIDQIEILPGTYSAQYGGANSGLIMTKLKTGVDDYKFNINFQTDKFASKGDKFLDTYSYRDHSFVATAGGPIGPTENRFFFALENLSIGDTQKRFSKGFEFDDMVDTNPYIEYGVIENVDTVNIKYPDGFTPFNSLDRWAFDGTMVFDFNPVQINLSGILNLTETKENDHPMLDIFNDRQYFYNNNQYLLTGKLSHKINPDFKYEVQFSRFSNKKEKEDPYMGTDWKTWADSAAVYRATNGKIIYRDPWYAQYDYIINGFNFNRSSTYESYTKNEQIYNGAALKLNYNLNEKIAFVFGGDYRRYTIRNYYMYPSIMRQAENYGGLSNIPEDIRDEFLGNTYGYELEGYTSEKEGIDGPKHPEFAALFLENIYKYNKINLNFGLRLDYLDTKGRKLKNPANVSDIENELILKKAKTYISPRLNLNVNPNSNTKFSFNYSKNVQSPKLNTQYWNFHTYSSQVLSGFYTQTPIGLDIDPVRTEILEINFQRSNVNLFDISLTGFYKKTKNQIRSAKINPDPGASMSPYLYITSGARSEIKGFEIKIDANLTNNVYIKGDYAFTNAVGNGSDEYSFLNKIDLGENYPNSLYTLDFEHQHNIILNLNYHFDNNEKNRWLRNSGLDFIFELSDGHPFTLSEGWAGSSPYDMGVDYMYDTRGKRALESLNSSRTKWNHTLNLKLYKEIRLYDQVSINFYCRVLNLLNTKNEINVYEKTGNPDNDGFNTNSIRKIYIQTFGKEYEDLNKAINFENGQSYWDVLGKQLYGHPRQILFGTEICY